MYAQNKAFQARVAEIEADKRAGVHKRARVLYEKRPDGLLVPVILREPLRFPWGGVVFALAAAIAAKGALYGYFGSETILTRVAGLEQGEFVQRACAFFLQPDPVTTQVAELITKLMA